MIGEQLFMSTVFVAGLLSFFAPCTFPLIPVYIGILTDNEGGGKWRPYIKTLLFVGGLSTSFILLGFGAGALGKYINGRMFSIVTGIIVVILGLHQMGFFHLKALDKYKVIQFNHTGKNELISTYLLGITFSFGWTPCVGPVLGAVLVVSAGGGQALYGGWLMAIYALGLAIPFMAIAILSKVILNRLHKVEKHLPKIKKVGGFLIVIMGLLLMTENLTTVTIWFEKLF
jgi:cytochrome c-type biogenesis protein